MEPGQDAAFGISGVCVPTGHQGVVLTPVSFRDTPVGHSYQLTPTAVQMQRVGKSLCAPAWVIAGNVCRELFPSHGWHLSWLKGELQLPLLRLCDLYAFVTFKLESLQMIEGYVSHHPRLCIL